MIKARGNVPLIAVCGATGLWLILRGVFPEAFIAFSPWIDAVVAGAMSLSAGILWISRPPASTSEHPARMPQRLEAMPSAEALSKAIEVLPDGVMYFDPDDVLLACNSACYRIYAGVEDLLIPGATYPQLARAVIERGLYHADAAEAEVVLEQCLAEHRSESGLNIQHLADGRTIKVQKRRTPEGGTVLMLSDVTADRGREKQIQRHNVVMTQVSEAVIVIDGDGYVTDLNPAAERLLGYPRSALLGQRADILYPQDQQARLKDQLERVLALQGRWEGQLSLVRRNGEQRLCETVVVPMRRDRGTAGGQILVSRDISDRQAAEARLNYLAHYDALTKLPNRMLFRDRLGQAILMSEGRRRQVAVIFLDLDNFQLINEGLGHEQGDEVLKEIASRLGATTRHGDTLARLGDDKFALIQTEMRRSEQAAFRTRHALDLLQPPVRLGERELRISASAGIAVYPDDGLGPDALIQAADVALTRAKAEGRNSYHFYVEGMTEQTRLRCDLEHELRRALQNREFVLHYQPQVDLSTGRVIGCEALVRWDHPRLGLLLPDQFIPIAEETGAIIPLGEWCLETVCAQVAEWRADARDVRRVAINLSPVQFSSPHLVETVAKALGDAQIPPECLELEITESAAMQDPDRAVAILMHLNELGVHSVIDDFGTGYASLSHLKRFPVHSLKVDQSFVAGVAHGGSDGAIVSAVIELGHSLNMEVIAEGIENEAQMRFLKAHKCDYGQGHSFARALSADELSDFVAHGAVGVG